MALVALWMAGTAEARGVEKPVDYMVDGQPYRGYVSYDSRAKALPIVLLVPNWLGTTEANRRQAREIAGRDYLVFLVDMYGRDAQPADPEAAGQRVGSLYGNRALLRSRVLAAKAAALEAVAKQGLPADPKHVAAIGFCFGGATALELARTGEPLDAVVSLHGNLSLEAPAENRPLRTRILALHGDADPFVPPAQVQDFEEEMRAAKADWQLVRFGGAVHSFTDPDAHMPGKAEYDPRVARRAFAIMRDFLAEAFGRP